MPVDNILARLEKVRSAGQDKWRAVCPVHGGKHRNLMISERPDRSVGVHCFVCSATGVDLMETLGMPVSEIFSPDSNYVRPVVTRQMTQERLEDDLVLSIAENDKANGRKLSLEDKKRVRLARHRINGIDTIIKNVDK
jgi:hypothetical protein